MKKTGVWILWLAILAWTAVMYGFSLQSLEASRLTSGGLTEWVLRLLRLSPESASTVEHLLRKTAHYSEFALEGVLLWRVFALSLRGSRRTWCFTILLGVLLSVTNEATQLLVNGRSCEALDMLIDFSGFLTGAYVASLTRKLFLSHRKKVGKKHD